MIGARTKNKGVQTSTPNFQTRALTLIAKRLTLILTDEYCLTRTNSERRRKTQSGIGGIIPFRQSCNPASLLRKTRWGEAQRRTPRRRDIQGRDRGGGTSGDSLQRRRPPSARGIKHLSEAANANMESRPSVRTFRPDRRAGSPRVGV